MISPGQHSGVDVQHIEAELRELWRREAAASGTPMTRLRTLNLVVMTGEAGVTADIEAALAAIPGRHPSRVVVLSVDRSIAGTAIHSEVGIRTAETGGLERQVSSEEITLSAPAAAVALLGGATLPLLVQDLPTYLWWAEPGDALASPLFEELSQACDRTIVDSAIAEAPGFAFLRGLGTHSGERGGHALADLNWNRLYEWRELTAQVFDSHETRDALDQVTGVEVAYESGASSAAGPAQALLYIGWLAGRLGWRPTAARAKGAEREIWFDGRRGDVSAKILGGEPIGGSSGGLVAVQLTSGPDDQDTHVLLRCADDLTTIESKVELPLSIERRRITRYERPATAEVLLGELDTRHADEVFREALGVVAAIPERVG